MPALREFRNQKLGELRVALLVPVVLAAVALTAVVLTYLAYFASLVLTRLSRSAGELFEAYPFILTGLEVIGGTLVLLALLPLVAVLLVLLGAVLALSALGVGSFPVYALFAWVMGNLVALAVRRWQPGLAERVQSRLLRYWGRQVPGIVRCLCYVPPVALILYLCVEGIRAVSA